MNNMSKLTTKAKTLILLGVALILLLLTILTFVITNALTNNDKLSGYTDKPYDDNLTLTVGMEENRKSSFYDGNLTNNLESQEYSFFVYVAKPRQQNKSLVVKYMNCQLIIKAEDKEYYYESAKKGSMDSASSSTAMSKNLLSTYFTMNNCVSKEFKNENENITDLNQTPVEVYVNLYYIMNKTDNITNDVETVEENIKYKVNFDDIEAINLDNVKEGIVKTESGSTKLISATENDPFALKVNYKKHAGQSSSREYYTDTFEFVVDLKPGNLKEVKIQTFDCSIIGVIENEKHDINNLFPERVLLGRFIGFLPEETTIHSIENELDTNYNLTTFYVFANVTFTDGKTTTLSYKINTSAI